MAHTDLSKDMVDLVMKIKKHLREHHQLSITLADPELLDRLVALKNLDDPVLQGMLSYLMALAGPQWTARFNSREEVPATESAAERKKLFGFYRGRNTPAEEDSTPRKSTAQKLAETLYRGSQPDDSPAPPSNSADPDRKPVRYYRGQPIYDD